MRDAVKKILVDYDFCDIGLKEAIDNLFLLFGSCEHYAIKYRDEDEEWGTVIMARNEDEAKKDIIETYPNAEFLEIRKFKWGL